MIYPFYVGEEVTIADTTRFPSLNGKVYTVTVLFPAWSGTPAMRVVDINGISNSFYCDQFRKLTPEEIDRLETNDGKAEK